MFSLSELLCLYNRNSLLILPNASLPFSKIRTLHPFQHLVRQTVFWPWSNTASRISKDYQAS